MADAPGTPAQDAPPEVAVEVGVEVAAVLRRAGFEPGPLVGRGVEGTVVDVGDGLVAKVWGGRPVEDVRRLADFYAAVDAGRPALATPRLVDVREVDGAVVSVEARLPGRALWVADGESPDLRREQVDAVLTALAALAGVPASPGLRVLPVLPGEPPLPGDRPFETELADLVRRRAGRGRAALAREVGGEGRLEELHAAVRSALLALPPAEPTLVHGDLIAANVLVEDGRAVAVVDFGFLSTAGDPAFDAAIATSCFDMYGPRAREVEATLEAAVVTGLGHDPARLAVHRAAYALVTATCFVPPDDPAATDGHLTWCAAMLRRPDVLEVLEVPRG